MEILCSCGYERVPAFAVLCPFLPPRVAWRLPVSQKSANFALLIFIEIQSASKYGFNRWSCRGIWRHNPFQ